VGKGALFESNFDCDILSTEVKIRSFILSCSFAASLALYIIRTYLAYLIVGEQPRGYDCIRIISDHLAILAEKVRATTR
jgi:hypothetical protein